MPEGFFWFLKAGKLHCGISQLGSVVFGTFKITATSPQQIMAHFGSSAALPVPPRNTERMTAKPSQTNLVNQSHGFISTNATWLPCKTFLPVCVWQLYQKEGWSLRSERVKKQTARVKGDTYSGWKIATGLEFLEGHGAGVSAKKEDERHQGDVRDIFAVVAHKLSSIFQALLRCQRWPVNGGVVLQKKRTFP